MKKLLQTILACMLCISIVGCAAAENPVTTVETGETTVGDGEIAEEIVNADETPSDENISEEKEMDAELLHALEYGFVPDSFGENWEFNITEKEMADLSVAAVTLCDATVADAWADMVQNASSDKNVQRDYGALFLFLSAQKMGCGTFLEWDYYNAKNAFYRKWDFNQSGEYPLFENICYEQIETEGLSEIKEVYIEPMDYISYSMLFSLGKVSLYSNKPVFDGDFFSGQDYLTRKEAVLAFSRLLDNSKDVYVPIEEESLYENEIWAEALTAGEALPSIEGDELPDWHGTSIARDILIYTDGRELYTEEDAKLIKEYGFNYVRIVCMHTDFIKEIEGQLYVNKHQMRNIDNIIGWCMENGIHVCLDLHSVPGYVSGGTPDILENQTHYEQALEIWNLLSSRYANIPANALSYNLLNEPALHYFTQESYGALAMDMISTIRKNDTDKMIVSDGLLSLGDIWQTGCPSVPCTELPADIVQSIHLYPSWKQGTDWMKLQNWSQEHMDAIGEFLHEGNDWTIKGDFKAGSEITLYYYQIIGVNNGVKLSWETNEVDDGEWILDGIVEDDNNCTDVYTNEWGTQCASYNQAALCIKFTEDSNYITLRLENNEIGAFISFESMLVKFKTETENTYLIPTTENVLGCKYETGNYACYYIDFADGGWTDGHVNIEIEDNGNYSCDNCPEGIEMYDKETLTSYIEMWAKWKQETGGKVICNEFAVSVALPEMVRATYMEDFLYLLDNYNIPWSLYTTNSGEYGPIHKCYTELGLPMTTGFEVLENYAVDMAVLNVLQKHMTE